MQRRCWCICLALVLVDTRLNQKADNFKVTLLSCYVQRRCSIICGALVIAGTRLNQKSDNFNVTLLSCYVARRWKSDFNVTILSCYIERPCTEHFSIMCGALVFVGTRLNQKSDNFKVTLLSCYVQRRTMCGALCLCRHQNQPEIGQLQGHHYELL